MADIVWKTVTLPDAFVGEAYEAGLAWNTAAAATTVTACVVTTGALPAGIVINADKVRLTGTPTAAGKFTFTLTMTDTAGTSVSGTLTLSVGFRAPGSDPFLAKTSVAEQVARAWH